MSEKRAETDTAPRARGWAHTVLAGVVAIHLVAGLLLATVDPAGVSAPAEVAAGGTADLPALPRAGDREPEPPASSGPTASIDTGAAVPAPSPAEGPAGPAPGEATAGATAQPADAAPLVVPDPGPPPALEPGRPPAQPAPPQAADSTAPPDSLPATAFAASAPATSESAQTFAREFPAHAAARQRADDPSSFHWAVIVGVNDYMGRTSSTIGSVSDALVLRDTLHRNGWRGDQVLTLTDHAATHDRIVRAIEWLMRSTDENSTVIFSFSGHMRHNAGVTALWPADNRFLWADDLGRMLGAVRADRLWVALQGCHAAGLAAPGLEGAGHLVTYASRVNEKAYEDPATRHSVLGYYLFAQGLRDGRGDEAGDRDGRTSVQEAFAWAAPRATSRTDGQQPHGPQRPVLVDGLAGRQFPIAVTGAPPPAGAPSTRAPGDDRNDDGSDGATSRRRPLLKLPFLSGGS